MPDKRTDDSGTNGNGKFYISWRWVVMVTIAIIGYLLSQGITSFSDKLNRQEAINKELFVNNKQVCDRVTVIETSLGYIKEAITEVNTLTKEIRDDQKRRARKE
jgi:hypothetical protein